MNLKARIAVSLIFALIVSGFSLEAARSNLESSHDPYDGRYLTTVRMKTIERAINAFKERTGRIPRDTVELAQLQTRAEMEDAWQHPFHYSVSGDHYRLVSLGRDGKPGGAWDNTDISSDDPDPRIRLPYRLFVSLPFFPTALGMSLVTGAVCFFIPWFGTRKGNRVNVATYIAFAFIGLTAVFISGIITMLHLLPPDH
jgi:hypothetical protein